MNLLVVFHSGSPLLIAVFLFLLIMSIATWVIIILRLIATNQAKNSCRVAYDAIRAASSLNEAEQYAKTSDSPVARLTLAAIAASRSYEEKQQKMLSVSLPKNEFLEREISHNMTTELNRMDKGLSILASVGATAPFIGLLGTVWGIYRALINISQSGQMSIAAVAGPIGEALISTAVGLFAAIPAVLAYNYFVRANKTFSRYMYSFAHDLHLYLINGKNKE